ncbi:McrB family protein [Neobacillus drentensis]|uniref:McrB family protein n=1 Tax=Neobacillus drentensis TaxID=220684 RepID=UPI002FFDFFA8
MPDTKEMIITKETVSEFVEAQRTNGTLGNEITLIIEKVINQQSGNSSRYQCRVLKSGELFIEMLNPLTNRPWELNFYFVKDAFTIGDVLVGRYEVQTQKRFLHDLIKPMPGTLKKLKRSNELVDRHGEDFVQFLQKKFNGEESLLGLMYDRWYETTERDISEHQEKISTLNSEINHLNDQVTEKVLQLKGIQAEIQAHEQTRLRIDQQVYDLRSSLGFVEEDWKEEAAIDFHNLKEDGDFIEAMQIGLYHQNGENLVYEYDIVRRFITALRTDQLVLLTGPSGTGKSSLVHQIGEVLHPCKVHHVAVQSNWTDVQDLLGFFNPLKNTYLPTPFLQALVDARNDKKSLHIICLDEMNLAHVEYYFSSLLSAREKQPDKRFLDLYAHKFYKEAKMDLEELLNMPIAEISAEDLKQLDAEKRKEARSKYELIFNFPAHFPIPDNVRFVGTLNMDETVKPLSPKVIDRSFIIELDHPSKLNDVREQLASQSIGGKLELNISEFILPALEEPKLSEEQKSVIDQVLEYSSVLKDIPNAMMNSRGIKHMERYVSSLPAVEGAVDELINSKILPRVMFPKAEKQLENVFDEFVARLPQASNSRAKAEKMKINKRVVQFWR